jgi:hypothetical protein
MTEESVDVFLGDFSYDENNDFKESEYLMSGGHKTQKIERTLPSGEKFEMYVTIEIPISQTTKLAY